MSAAAKPRAVHNVPTSVFPPGQIFEGHIDGRPFISDRSVMLLDCRFDSNQLIRQLGPGAVLNMLQADYSDVSVVERELSPHHVIHFSNGEYLAGRYVDLIEKLWLRRGQWAFSDSLNTFCYRVDGEPVAFVAPLIYHNDVDLTTQED